MELRPRFEVGAPSTSAIDKTKIQPASARRRQRRALALVFSTSNSFGETMFTASADCQQIVLFAFPPMKISRSLVSIRRPESICHLYSFGRNLSAKVESSLNCSGSSRRNRSVCAAASSSVISEKLLMAVKQHEHPGLTLLLSPPT